MHPVQSATTGTKVTAVPPEHEGCPSHPETVEVWVDDVLGVCAVDDDDVREVVGGGLLDGRG